MMISKDMLVVCLMILLIVDTASGNHTGWWTCHSVCQRCKRQSVGIEDWISETYPELFSSQPEVGFNYENLNNGNLRSSNTGCCETELTHNVPMSASDGIHNYTVVNLQGEFQFIPYGTCRPGTSCVNGTCVQMLRNHWVLVYNNTKLPTAAPVSFIPMEIPSHCECVNIGKARP